MRTRSGQEYFNTAWLILKGTYTSSQVPGNLEAGENINWNSLFTGAGFQSNVFMP